MAKQDIWDFPDCSIAQRRRFRRIMSVLFEKGFATVDELVDTLGVSRMTVHRDLDDLDSRGTLTKVRGGATVGRTEQFESSWEYRTRVELGRKQAIAAKAIEYVEPGDSLMLDPSTTAHIFSKYLVSKTPLKVVTPNLHIINELADVQGIELHSLGGVYDLHFSAFMGAHSELSAASFRVDKIFMSTAAISGRTVCHSQARAIRLDRALFEVARQHILILDSSKLGNSALHVFGDVSEWDIIITDDGATEAELDVLRGAGPEVIVAKVADVAESD
ncbi:MAG: DeoR/GlpR family DNA-binding transcription regulator [Propionibacteriaceae bacterium]|jgi:DeoR/GlpR family transcriptional regulator of sugar metabolism|nr:DeoR/GlpR family DNA-binding transcription regulator [Propionibacteriaceae bacterium]